MRIVLLTTQFSPYHIELAEAVNSYPGVSLRIIFSRQTTRPSHWLSGSDSPYCELIPEGLQRSEALDRIESLIEGEFPSVIVVGGIRGLIYKAAARATRKRGTPIGFWLEQPTPHLGGIYQELRNIEYRCRLRRSSFVLAIGDRAASFYRTLCRQVAMVPYGEDLSTCFAFKRVGKSKGKVRFLFSGQLVPRHNIRLLMRVVLKLYERVGANFELVLAAYGPEQRVVERLLTMRSELREVVTYDGGYAAWSDRLRIFGACDVLVYPSCHSGWGLVVPEAMAAGMFVITTPRVEAARYLIESGVNGVVIEPREDLLELEMMRCLQDRDRVFELGQRARIGARKADVTSVAPQFVDAIARFISGDEC